MKHYNIVKQTAHHIIFASVLLLVANVAIWVTSYHYISPTPAKAACNVGAQPATFTTSSQADQSVIVTFTNRTISDTFQYRVEVIDNYDFNPLTRYDQTFTSPTAPELPDPVVSSFTGLDPNSAVNTKIRVTFTTSLSDSAPCVHTPVENTLTSGGTGGGTTGGDSEADLTPDTINIPELFGTFTFPKHITSIAQIFKIVTEFMVWILGALAFISLVMGGIQFVTSGGDPTKAAKAKKTLLYSAAGIVLAVLSVSIYNIVVGFWAGP